MSVYEDIEADVQEKVKDTVVGIIEDGVKHSWDTIQDPGGWVSGRIPNGPQFPGTRQMARSACRRWARGAGPQGAVADMGYRPFCEEYLDDIGELPGGGEFGPTQEGGQCPVAYSVTVRYSDEFAADEENFVPRQFDATRQCVGPILGLEGNPADSGPNKELSIKHGSSPTWTRTGLTNVPYPCSIQPNNYRNCNAEIIALSRLDGLPDDCGNGKDGYQPTTYLPDDGGGTEPISVPGFPPFVIDIGPDGEITVDFPNFDGPGRSIEDPFDQPDPDEYGPEVPPPPPPGDRGEPGNPENVDPGEDFEDFDPDKVLVGIKVTLTQIAPRARVSFLGGSPYYSYAYSVSMGGDAGTERDNDAAFAPPAAFYHAPENSNRYSVAFRNGFGGTVIPYWKEVSED